MAYQTQQAYKRSLAGSVGAGISSILNAQGRTYYILEHKVSSLYHKAGESQRIIVDQIELGRDSKCQVRFDENFGTVSRRHAAIVRNGNNWKLIQLSQTNQTFLNGHPIESEWYLQNGDEIQLAVNGPKLGFIVPQGEKSFVKSIGLTARLNLFGQQALRPYKTAIAILSSVLVLAVAGLVGWNINTQIEYNKTIRNIQLEAEKIQNEATAKNDSLMIAVVEQNKVASSLKESLNKLQARVSGTDKDISVHTPTVSSIKGVEMNQCLPYVYYVRANKLVLTFQGETKEIDGDWSGTGFLLEGGKFVTARHVVEPWFFPSSEQDMFLNVIAHNGGDIVAYFTAYSPNGDQFHFTSKQVQCDRSSDETKFDQGYTFKFAQFDGSDWATFLVANGKKGLPFNKSLSKDLKTKNDLTILGYPHGYGAHSPSDITPIYGNAVVAKDGLEHGMILTTDRNFEHGNSGGPVFHTDNSGGLVVIGIISAGEGSSLGFIVPIASIR